MYIYIYIYGYMYVYTYTCMYMYIHIHSVYLTIREKKADCQDIVPEHVTRLICIIVSNVACIYVFCQNRNMYICIVSLQKRC